MSHSMQDKIVFYCWKTRGFKELWKKEHVPRLAICFVTKVWEKLESNGPWLCFQGKLYDWNILTLDCWAVYIFIICFLFCPVVPFEHIQVNISPARSRSFFPIVPWILRSGVSWLSILDMKHVLAWLACKNKFESSQEFSVKQFPL